LRVALVILHADSARGGAERYTVDLAAALARRGHDVCLLASSFADAIDNVRFIPLDHRGATRAGRYLRLLDSLDAHLATERYDIVHAMLPVRACDIYHPHAGIAAEATERWTTHFNPRRRAMAKVERKLLTGPKLPTLLALSEYVKRSIRRHYALPEDRLATLFNAVDLEQFNPARRDADRAEVRHDWYVDKDPQRVMALMIANDFERKGLKETMQAWAMLWEENLTLVVVGNDQVPKWIKERASTTQAAHAAFFPGPTKRSYRYYAGADFLVLPTKHDPCSLVVLEALAMGLPVISTKFNGACEIMTDGVHGYVLDDPNDVAALAEAMRKLMDPQRRAEMSKACLELRPQLSYEHHLDRLMEIYQRVIRERG